MGIEICWTQPLTSQVFYWLYLENGKRYGKTVSQLLYHFTSSSKQNNKQKTKISFHKHFKPQRTGHGGFTCLVIQFTEFLLFLIGDAGNSLSYHNTMKFSTWDSDNDKSGGKCAANWKGGWWYKSCAYVNLNGLYLGAGKDHYTGNHWRGWTKYSLKKVEMKIRPSQL